MARFRAKDSGEQLPVLSMVVEGCDIDHHNHASAINEQAKSVATSISTEEVTWEEATVQFGEAGGSPGVPTLAPDGKRCSLVTVNMATEREEWPDT